MAKDSADKLTTDMLKATGRGGARPGAGRKPGDRPPRKQPSWRVSQEAIESIVDAAEESGHSPGDVLDWVMKNHRKIPKKL